MKAFNIWVTNKCNLKCKYCYEGIEKANKELKIESIDSIVDFVKKMSGNENCVMVNFHGGEPLLNFKAIDEICKKLDNETIRKSYSLTTNGLLLNDNIIEKILEYKIGLSISIDGTRYYHDKNRVDIVGAGSWERVMKNAISAKSKGVDVRIRMTITPNNCEGIVENVEMLKSKGFEDIIAVPDFFSAEWDKCKIDKIKEKLKFIFNENNNNGFVFFEEGLRCKDICRGGIEECNIDTDLNLYPCVYVVGEKQYCIGNVNTGIRLECLNEMFSVREKENVTCKDCNMLPYCISSRCKIINKQLTGEYLCASPVVCAFENIIFSVYH